MIRVHLFCCALGHILIFNVMDQGYIFLEIILDLNYTTMTTFSYGQGFVANLVAIDLHSSGRGNMLEWHLFSANLKKFFLTTLVFLIPLSLSHTHTHYARFATAPFHKIIIEYSQNTQ